VLNWAPCNQDVKGNVGMAPCILSVGIGCGWLVNSGPFTHRTHWIGRFMGRGSSGKEENILLLWESNPDCSDVLLLEMQIWECGLDLICFGWNPVVRSCEHGNDISCPIKAAVLTCRATETPKNSARGSSYNSDYLCRRLHCGLQDLGRSRHSSLFHSL
jgi:hypothetical protein